MKILSSHKNKDDSRRISIKFTKEEMNLLKLAYKRDRFSIEILQNIFADAINSKINKTDTTNLEDKNGL